MQQKYRLSDFELSINPGVWTAAQALLESGAVRNIRELEKNFWVALVDDDGAQYEVEAILTPKRVKAFTCECWSEHRRLVCPHVAATLLKVRQYLDQRNEERQKALESRQQQPSRLTIQSVLKDVSAEELSDFVREYARRDRDFALALKTWFAGVEGSMHNAYLLVLDAAIPSKSLQTGRARETDFRRLRKTLSDLEAQLEKAHNTQNLPQLYQIAAALLEKLGPLSAKLDGEKQQHLLYYCRLALKSFDAVLGPDSSPELRNACWQQLCLWASKDWFGKELKRELVTLMAPKASDNLAFADIEALFERSGDPPTEHILQLMLAALAQRGLPEAGLRILESYPQSPAAARDTILLLNQLHYFKAAAMIGEAMLEKNTFKYFEKIEIEDLLLRIAQKTNDAPAQIRLLKHRFLAKAQTEVFQQLKQVAGAKWPKVLKQLLAELQQQGNLHAISVVLAAEGETAALHELLNGCKDTDLLLLHADYLDDAFLQERYTHILTEHLNEHFGLPASVQVRSQLNGLVQKSRFTLVINIIKHLVAQFPDRTSLPEELAEVFPKNKRKTPSL